MKDVEEKTASWVLQRTYTDTDETTPLVFVLPVTRGREWKKKSSIDRSTDQPIDRSINQSTDRSIHSSINGSIHQSINGSTNWLIIWSINQSRSTSQFVNQSAVAINQSTNWFRESVGTLNLIRPSVRPSVRLSVRHKNFNLAHIFWSINDRALILGMHDHCDKPFLLVPCGNLDLDLSQGQICCQAGDHNSSNLLVNFSTHKWINQSHGT